MVPKTLPDVRDRNGEERNILPYRGSEHTDSGQAVVGRAFAGYARRPPYSTGKMGAPGRRSVFYEAMQLYRERGTESIAVLKHNRAPVSAQCAPQQTCGACLPV